MAKKEYSASKEVLKELIVIPIALIPMVFAAILTFVLPEKFVEDLSFEGLFYLAIVVICLTLYLISGVITLFKRFKKKINLMNIKNNPIGKVVKVVVDRPLGSVHPKHNDIIYHVNYGYIKGIYSNDNEEQDVYILGVKEPLKVFEGEVIAVIKRYDDVEDKWVVVPKGITYTKEEIYKEVEFQEKYFQTEIRM